MKRYLYRDVNNFCFGENMGFQSQNRIRWKPAFFRGDVLETSGIVPVVDLSFASAEYHLDEAGTELFVV